MKNNEFWEYPRIPKEKHPHSPRRERSSLVRGEEAIHVLP